MNTLTSQGVEVKVEPFFEQDYSGPEGDDFMFGYRVTITNNNPFPVKLQGRHWEIFDTLEVFREVEGPGVIGLQPVIAPGQKFQYVSGVNLHSEMGQMSGWYDMINTETKDYLRVWIPCFDLIVPFRLN